MSKTCETDGCGRPVPPPGRTGGAPRRLCEVCSPRRVRLHAIPSDPGPGRPASGRRHRPGPVQRAARTALADIDTDHAAAGLLIAVAERLARDVDQADSIRDRVAAARELLAVVDALDTAVVPPARPRPGPADDSGDGDVFGIGGAPPALGDPGQPPAASL